MAEDEEARADRGVDLVDLHESKLADGGGEPEQGLGLDLGVLLSHGELDGVDGHVVEADGFGDGRQRVSGRGGALGVGQLVDHVGHAELGRTFRELGALGQQLHHLQFQLQHLRCRRSHNQSTFLLRVD